MAISTLSKTENKIELGEFIDYIESNIDVEDEDSIVSASDMLQALANNKKLLVDNFNYDLIRFDTHQSSSYSQSSTVLGAGKLKNFVVRANLWPGKSATEVKTFEDSLFSYELAHDHNFSFLTANYFGPGYETEIWENLNPKKVVDLGQSVDLEFLERTILEPNKVMYYRRKRDIHIQHPPEKFSVSLNLLVTKDQDFLDDQLEFDVTNKTVKNFPKGTLTSRREFFMHVAGIIGDQNTADILFRISKLHQCKRTREAALSSANLILENKTSSLNFNI